jgi:hypothetical protein
VVGGPGRAQDDIHDMPLTCRMHHLAGCALDRFRFQPTGRELVTMGAEAFLPKPFDVEDLLALVLFYAQVGPRRLVER